ncbi:MAG: 1,2-phenylacetyl-CoA epoxidase subunit PaaE [Burkholderiaceae bacterium]
MSLISFHCLRVAGVERDADALIVGLDVPEALRETFAFTAGQYLTLRTFVDGQDLRRPYSICSAPGQAPLQVGVRLLPGGAFSGWALANLREGDSLDVLPPLGRFFVPLEPQARRHFLFVAAGSGITPVLSLIKTTLAREPDSSCTLIYGNRRLASTMFRDTLAELKNRHIARFATHYVFSREEQDAPLFNGRIDATRMAGFLEALIPAASIDSAFVCGPAGMIEAVCAALAAAGIADERVHVERFGDSADASDHHVEESDTDHAQVTLVIDGLGRRIEFLLSDPSILEAARRSGLDVPYACKAGVCSTCKGKLLEGEVRMDRNFALSADEVAQGFVLCCQSHPTSAKVIITLDQR